jgi:hypothetical protein
MQTKPLNARWRFGSSFIVFNSETDSFETKKDWDQYEACKTCRGGAPIDETPDGDLICATCKAAFPRGVS